MGFNKVDKMLGGFNFNSTGGKFLKKSLCCFNKLKMENPQKEGKTISNSQIKSLLGKL